MYECIIDDVGRVTSFVFADHSYVIINIPHCYYHPFLFVDWHNKNSVSYDVRFFQWYSVTNIAIYIINNELRYHCSIYYITKIASVMMWELTLDEWEKILLLNSWLDASFFGDVWWSRGYSISVDYWYRRRRYESPRCQKVFQWYSVTNIAIYIINNELRYYCSINCVF